jgi:hypothetical protein
MGGEERVAAAMTGAGARAGADGRSIVTRVCYSGAQIIDRG